MFKKKTEEEIDKEFLSAVQKVCKKYKRGIAPQLRIVREDATEKKPEVPSKS